MDCLMFFAAALLLLIAVFVALDVSRANRKCRHAQKCRDEVIRRRMNGQKRLDD